MLTLLSFKSSLPQLEVTASLNANFTLSAPRIIFCVLYLLFSVLCIFSVNVDQLSCPGLCSQLIKLSAAF